jgi:flagellum-specific ATP synthase
MLAHYSENRDLVQVGAYRRGADPLLDQTLDRIDRIEQLVHSGNQPARALEETVAAMAALAAGVR